MTGSLPLFDLLRPPAAAGAPSFPAGPPRSAEVRLFGVRHHGPGSAWALETALAAFKPEKVLVEWPHDAASAMEGIFDPELVAPAAALIRATDGSGRAAFLPFAEFSPEWRALKWAAANGASAEAIDLPFGVRTAMEEDASGGGDPLGRLARAAGMEDGEAWWDRFVEGAGAPFEAVAEAMRALREDEAALGAREAAREWWMRRSLRSAAAEGGRIAAVVGAWHVPALERWREDEPDAVLPAGTPVACGWVPWSWERLRGGSGYGAGVRSPAWYALAWETRKKGAGRTRERAARWLSKTAAALRSAGHDVSAAATVEAVRLAEEISALREEPQARLEILEEAARAVMTGGDGAVLARLDRELHAPHVVGRVPARLFAGSLEADLEAQCARWRLSKDAAEAEMSLDLRKDLDLGRSFLLHRLSMIGVAWGKGMGGGGKGTFKEAWRLRWTPEASCALAEASPSGTTIEEAAGAKGFSDLETAEDLAAACRVVENAMKAGLHGVLSAAADAAGRISAGTEGVADLAAALVPIVEAAKWGGVRGWKGTDLADLAFVLCARAAARLPAEAAGLADDACADLGAAAEAGFHAAEELDSARIASGGAAAEWIEALILVEGSEGAGAGMRGLSCRMLLDRGALMPGFAADRLRAALSPAYGAARGAAWLEGFLRGSAVVLLNDPPLLSAVRSWISGMEEDDFVAVLPLLRRAFSKVPEGERRSMSRASRGGAGLILSPAGRRDERALRKAAEAASAILGGTRGGGAAEGWR